MNKNKLPIMILSLLAFIVLGLSGCSGWQNEGHKPILLIEVEDWDNSGSTIKNLRIVDDANNIITIFSGEFELQAGYEDQLSGGYSYYLTPGTGYTKLIYDNDGSDSEVLIDIKNAEVGMIYFAGIG